SLRYFFISRSTTPRMASLITTRVLAVKRQVRLMRCLAAVPPTSLRPIFANDTRPTCIAAAVRALRGLAWLSRRPEHTLITQAIASMGFMAVPARKGFGLVNKNFLPKGGLRRNRHSFWSRGKVGMTQLSGMEFPNSEKAFPSPRVGEVPAQPRD